MTKKKKEYDPLYTEMRKEYLDEWRIWYKMNWSCRKQAKYYVDIQVCEEWKGSEGFLEWLDHIGPKPSEDMVMDRISKIGDYEPGNVEWTTKETNMNRCRKHQDPDEIAYYGAIARKNGIKRHTFQNRVYRGWDLNDAATLEPLPVKYKDRLL